eukprot:6478164-Amphidinium_carterae.1
MFMEMQTITIPKKNVIEPDPFVFALAIVPHSLDNLRSASDKIGTIQGRLAWPVAVAVAVAVAAQRITSALEN